MRNLALGAVLAAAVLASGLPAAAAAGAFQVAGYAGKCADDTGNSASPGTAVQAWSCNGGKAQQWMFTAGELRHGSLCMNARGGARNGAPVILWRCDDAANENWVYSSAAGGRYFLRASGLCLDDPGFSRRDGTRLVVWRCNGGANQRWSPPPGVLPSPAPGGCYPLTAGGNCYEPGEFCAAADRGMSGVAGDGEAIICEDRSGWRWEPA